MQKNSPLAYLMLALISLVLVLLGIFVFQLNNIEERFILQSKQIRAMGDASERLASRVDRLIGEIQSGQLQTSSATRPRSTPESAHADVKLLHPEVENFLVDEKVDWPLPGASPTGVLSRGWRSGDPKGFNAITENAAELGGMVLHYVSPSLARRHAWDDPELFEGDLAWRVEITDDFKEFTFYLRKGVYWQTPAGIDLDDPKFEWLRGRHEITAHDVVFTLDMMNHPQVENGYMKAYYQDLKDWEAIDDYTLVVRWKRKLYGNLDSTLLIGPMPEFIYAFDASGHRYPEETIGLRFNQHWYNNKGVVGASWYHFDRYEPGAQIRLLRNEDYQGRKPAIRELVYPIYTDPNKTLLLLKAHEVDFASLRAGQYREEILRWQDVPEQERPKDSPFLNGDIHCQKEMQAAFYYIGWNANKPLFSDARVRRAMTMAFNRQGIIENVYVGLGQIATGPFLPSSPGNDPDITPIPFDLEAARLLLAEAGWSDTDGDGLLDKDLSPDDDDPTRSPFNFRLLIYGSSPEYTSLANIFKEDLLEIGVKLDIEAADWSLMQKKMDEKNFDAHTGGWGLGWTSDPYQLWHSSQADVPRGSNRIGFRNAEADVLIEKLRETFDPQERTRMLRAFHGILHEEQPYTFFRVLESPVCWWNDLENVVFAKPSPQVNTLPWSVRVQP